MAQPPNTNKRTTVRFGGADDNSIRSAWKTTNRCLKPPSPAERKATMGADAIEAAKDAAALVAKLDLNDHSFSNHSQHSEGGDVVSPIKPFRHQKSSLKTRSKTVPILKNRLEDDDPTVPPKTAFRSAWTTSEASHSIRSILGPSPAQRQKTLEEADLREASASIRAMAEDSSSSIFNSSSREFSAKSGVRGFRDSSLKDSNHSVQPFRDDPRW